MAFILLIFENSLRPAIKYFCMICFYNRLITASPYAFCSNSPVNFVDPDGEDVWNVYEDGSIKWISKSLGDVVRIVDMKGNVLNNISFEQSVLSKMTLNPGNKDYSYFTVSDAVCAKKLFEFIATPSNWGKDNNTENSDVIIESAVIYTDKGNAVLLGGIGHTPTEQLADRYIELNAVFSRIDHVHPNNVQTPSGTGELNGDIGTIYRLEQKGIKFSTPEENRYHIYTPVNQQYYPYDIYTTYILEAAACVADK